MLPPNDFFFAFDIPPVTTPNDVERCELVLDNFSSSCEPSYFCLREYSIWRFFSKALRMTTRELVSKCKWKHKKFCIICPNVRESLTLTERSLNLLIDFRSYRMRVGFVTLEYHPVHSKPVRLTIPIPPKAFDGVDSIRECFEVMGFTFFYSLFSLLEPEDRLSVTLLYQTRAANGDKKTSERNDEAKNKEKNPKDDDSAKEGDCI